MFLIDLLVQISGIVYLVFPQHSVVRNVFDFWLILVPLFLGVLERVDSLLISNPVR